MLNDLIADSITRVRNAYMRRLDTTTLLHSKTIESIVKILQDKGYIENYNVEENGVKKTINVVLKYDDNAKPAIKEITRISKPGRRVYKASAEIKSFKNGYGTFIVSTPNGVVANDDAFKNNAGGEVLCSVW